MKKILFYFWQSKSLTGSGWLFAEKLTQGILSIILTAAIARHLGTLQFGQLTFATTYVAFFFVAATLSMDAVVIRNLARATTSPGETLGSCLTIRIAFGLLTWVLSSVSIFILKSGTTDSFWPVLIIGSTLFTQAFHTTDLWFQSQSKASLGAKGRLCGTLFSSSIKVGLLVNQAPLSWFFFSIALDTIIAAIFLSIIYKKYPCPTRWQASSKLIIELIQSSWPLALSGVAIMTFMKVDQLIVASVLGEEALGVYATAATLSQGFAFIPSVIVAIKSPSIARARIDNHKQYLEEMARLLRQIGLFSIVLCLSLSLLSPLLIPVIFGSAYTKSSQVFSLLVFNNICIFIGMAQGIFIINESLQRITFISTLISALCALAFSLIFTPTYGLIGAASSALTANLISVVILPMMLSNKVRELYKYSFLTRHFSRTLP